MIEEQPSPKATVLITSKDRCGLLRQAIKSVYQQDIDLELIIVDDGSADETSAMVASEFPKAILIRNKNSLGIIDARNQAAKLVRTKILFTLDDDAIYTGPDIVSKTLKCFDHPHVGAVAIPHINIIDQHEEPINLVEWIDDLDFPCISSYSGGTNAKRIDIFRALGGYGGLGRQGEEVNYCLRLLSQGFVVRVANTSPIHHFPQHGAMYKELIIKSSAKNNLIFIWEHVPLPNLLTHFGGAVINQLCLGIKERKLKAVISGLFDGLLKLALVARIPVSKRTYKLHRRLRKNGPLRYSEIKHEIENLAEARYDAQEPPHSQI